MYGPTMVTDIYTSFSFSHTSTFQLLDKPWSQVSSLFPPRFLPSIVIDIVYTMLTLSGLALY